MTETQKNNQALSDTVTSTPPTSIPPLRPELEITIMESLSPGKPPCLRVFAIPELAHMICKPARKHDYARLMRVCRQLFRDIRPFVWESTSAIMAMMSMIPGARIVPLPPPPGPWGRMTLRLPPKAREQVISFPTSLDLSRLNLYAPYVKQLDIPRKLHVEVDENWDRFLAATRSTALLPNLERIRLAQNGFDLRSCIPESSVRWMTVFLSPSLSSLCILPPPSSKWVLAVSDYLVTFKSAQRLLDGLSKQCPQIDSLKLFIGDPIMQSYKGSPGSWTSSAIEFSYTSPEIPLMIARLQSLRTLTITPFILLNEAFHALAKLPSLESLTIYSERSSERVYANDLMLPDHSFLSLQHLELHHITCATIRNLCREASIWKGLRVLRVHGFELHRWPVPEYDRHLLTEMISSLADHQAPITTLDLVGATHQLISCEMAHSLKRLPLTSLYLGQIGSDFSNLENMLAALPSLEELRIHTHTGFHLPQLHLMITSLPQLRKLAIHVDDHALDHLQMEDIIPCQTQCHDKFWLASNIRIPGTYEGVKRIARYLSALKPNMVYAHFGTDTHYTIDIDWEGSSEHILDIALSELREALASCSALSFCPSWSADTGFTHTPSKPG